MRKLVTEKGTCNFLIDIVKADLKSYSEMDRYCRTDRTGKIQPYWRGGDSGTVAMVVYFFFPHMLFISATISSTGVQSRSSAVLRGGLLVSDSLGRF